MSWIIMNKVKSGGTWKKEKFQTGGRIFHDFKEAQNTKRKLNAMSSSINFKVVRV